MKVLAYDPFLSEKRALELGVEKVELDDAAGARRHHHPAHAADRRDAQHPLARSAGEDQARACASSTAPAAAWWTRRRWPTRIKSGHVAGAALDVFETEPATDSPLFGLDNVVCTPHLGAATAEAQENVALQVAEQMSDFLLTGAVTNAINMPSVSAEDAPRLKPYMELCRLLGAFAGQLTQAREGVDPPRRDRIRGPGRAAEHSAADRRRAGRADVAADGRREHGQRRRSPRATTASTSPKPCTTGPANTRRWCASRSRPTSMTRSVAGTLFAGSRPRIVEIKGIKVEADFAPHMLYVTNQDKPGFIGRFGATLAGAGINIATFHLGRAQPGGDAICLVSVDEPVPEDVLAMVRTLPLVVQATALAF